MTQEEIMTVLEERVNDCPDEVLSELADHLMRCIQTPACVSPCWDYSEEAKAAWFMFVSLQASDQILSGGAAHHVHVLHQLSIKCR